MMEGNVVLAAVPQANGQVKNRPAIVLRTMIPFHDLLVCGVSTQLHHQAPNFDDLITRTDADFQMSGLLADSIIRLGFLTVLPRSKIIGAIGEISVERHRRLLTNLSGYLIANFAENAP